MYTGCDRRQEISLFSHSEIAPPPVVCARYPISPTSSKTGILYAQHGKHATSLEIPDNTESRWYQTMGSPNRRLDVSKLYYDRKYSNAPRNSYRHVAREHLQRSWPAN